MGVSWRITDVVLLESDEEATFQEWAAAINSALADPAYRSGMGVVHDARRMLAIPSSAEVQNRVEFLRSRMRRSGARRWAVVVGSSSPAYFGMARMGEAFADELRAPFRVFMEDLTAAIEWARG